MREDIHIFLKKNTPLTVTEIDSMLHTIRGENDRILGSEKISYPYSSITAKEINKQIEEATKQIKDIFTEVMEGGQLHIEEIKESILPAIKQASEIPHIYHLFYELNSVDEYTYKHTICVGIIANMIGKWLHLSPEDLDVLTLGATLHDIGKTKIPQEILNKPGRLTKEEYEEMKRHTIYGYDLLKEIESLDKEIPLIALQHHEREDGNGYPIGLESEQISYFAKIVAVADVFHAMSSSRVYHEASPFYTVMKQMQRDAYGRLDPVIVLSFLNKMMNNLVGKRVILNDQRVGKIMMIDPYDPIRCLIQVDNCHIDLRYNTSLQIDRIIEDEV